MATYTTVSFYFAMAVAAIGCVVVLAIPSKRSAIFDALRHPFGGSDDETTDIAGELAVESDWHQVPMAASHAQRAKGAHTAHHA